MGKERGDRGRGKMGNKFLIMLFVQDINVTRWSVGVKRQRQERHVSPGIGEDFKMHTWHSDRGVGALP